MAYGGGVRSGWGAAKKGKGRGDGRAPSAAGKACGPKGDMRLYRLGLGSKGRGKAYSGKGYGAYASYGGGRGVLRTIGGRGKGKMKVDSSVYAKGYAKRYDATHDATYGNIYGRAYSKNVGKSYGKSYGKRQGGKGRGATYGKGYAAIKGKTNNKGVGRGKGWRKGKSKGKGKGKGKGKLKGKRAVVSKEFLDKQLEEYMGPDAIKSMLDQELEAYFKDKKALEVASSTIASAAEGGVGGSKPAASAAGHATAGSV